MSITLHQLRAFRGPNIHSPNQGVFAQFSSTLQLAQPLEYALKDAAQRIGLIITRPQIEQYDSYYTLYLDTEQPHLAAEMLKTLVQTIQTFGDPEFAETDFDELLWPLKQQHRRQALHISSLQILAEARQRSIPYFLRDDGTIQLGYGKRGQTFWPQKQYNDGLIQGDSISIKRQHNAPNINWQQLGSIPIIACCGYSQHQQCASLLAQQHPEAQLELKADFANTQQLLAQRDSQLAILALDAQSLSHDGLAFQACQHSLIIDLPSNASEQQAQELGLAMLVTRSDGITVLNIDNPQLAALREYCSSQLIVISRDPANPLLQQHCQQGGTALFVRDQQLIFAQQQQYQLLKHAQPNTLDYAQLAVLAFHALLS